VFLVESPISIACPTLEHSAHTRTDYTEQEKKIRMDLASGIGLVPIHGITSLHVAHENKIMISYERHAQDPKPCHLRRDGWVRWLSIPDIVGVTQSSTMLCAKPTTKDGWVSSNHTRTEGDFKPVLEDCKAIS